MSARVALLWMITTSVALACPVCGGGDAPNQQAFVDTMIFMSLFPLAMLGSITGIVVFRYRQIAQGEGSQAEG